MRFRVQNIRKGYCEVWANERDGERYKHLAVVLRDESSNGRGKSWHWSAKPDEPPFHMPYRTNEFDTRRECVNHCMKTALKRLVERAIEQQPKESQHWHSPRRDALSAVYMNMYGHKLFFTPDEMDEIERRLETFE